MIGINIAASVVMRGLRLRFCTEMTWMATAEVAAVEDMMIMAVCSLTTEHASDMLASAIEQKDILLKGPGLSHRHHPLEGMSMCMPLPNQYDRMRRSSVETLSVWGLK